MECKFSHFQKYYYHLIVINTFKIYFKKKTKFSNSEGGVLMVPPVLTPTPTFLIQVSPAPALAPKKLTRGGPPLSTFRLRFRSLRKKLFDFILKFLTEKEWGESQVRDPKLNNFFFHICLELPKET